MSLNPKVHFPDIVYAPDTSKVRACIQNTGNENAIRSI